MTCIAAFFIACTATVLIMAKCAKPGHEDADGFHAGHECSDYSEPDGNR